ncbi:glycerol-3-phosphate dehydrogenase 1-like, isoform CRA_g [Mus musculus]|nr:glycerol-3-phosphate dehydrogenase 1-like, isoform CRA_g [Mus musculus]
MAAAPLKVCIVGSGNWGSAVAKIIGSNVKTLQKFSSTVKMWVFEETVNGRKLTDIINNDHENVKYLPGHKLPENVVAVPNLSEAVQDADLLVFVIPHQFDPTAKPQIPGVPPGIQCFHMPSMHFGCSLQQRATALENLQPLLNNAL